MARVSKHYINNKRLYETYCEYYEKIKFNKENGIDKLPPVPKYIGEAIVEISNRYASKPGFYSYVFKDEMIADAVENALRYFDRFNIERGKNPFAYLTQIIKNAFIRRIKKEKTLLVRKHKYLESQSILGFTDQIARQPSDDRHYYITSTGLDSDYMNDLVEVEELKRIEKNEKAGDLKKARRKHPSSSSSGT